MRRRNRLICTAAALTAALALEPNVKADAVDVGNLTVAASWRAQPASIAEGGATMFKLALTATGDDATSGIAFGESTFHFNSGSSDSVPITKDLTLAASAPSAGDTLATRVPGFSVTYFTEGIYSATMQTSGAPISWNEAGVSRSGAYDLSIATLISVGNALPALESANVPLLIAVGQSFGFSASADAGLLNSVNYNWDFDYNGSFAADSQEQNPMFAYTTAGFHTGMLRVSDDTGSYTPFEFAVNVRQMDPAAVPLPLAVWGGLGLMASVTILRARGAARQAALASIALAAGLIVGAASPARAESVIDLASSPNASGIDGQGARFFNAYPQPTGSGVIDPFLTIQHNVTEKGYNTDGDLQFDEKRAEQYTKAILTASVNPVTLDGVQYAQFLLDINEMDSGNRELLSLNKLQLWSTNDPNIGGYVDNATTDGSTAPGFAASTATKLYDLDGIGDKRIEMNYTFGTGSGSGDMFAYIPYSLVANSPGQYLVLFSAFGNPNESDDGYEEWAYDSRTPTAAVPLPMAVWGGLSLLGAVATRKLMRTSET